MKKIFLLLLFFPLAKSLPAQPALTDCINYIFNHMDSIQKAGESAFEVWKDCVLEKQIPEFTAKTLSGETIGMNALKGNVVLINFWSIECRPCIAELPGLNKLVKEYKENKVVFLAITWESVSRIQKYFLPKYKFDCSIVPDALPIIDKIAASGYPTTYIINKKGMIKAAWNGGSTGEKAGEEYYQRSKPIIDSLLNAE